MSPYAFWGISITSLKRTTESEWPRRCSSTSRRRSRSGPLVKRAPSGASGGSNLLLDWESLFFGRNAHTSGAIAIGPVHRADLLRIVTAPIESSDIERIAQMFPDEANRYKQDIRVIFGDCEQFIWSFFPMNDYPFKGLLGIDKLPPEAPCEQLGPGMLSEQDMARCWESVALTDAETQVIEALQLVSDSEVSRGNHGRIWPIKRNGESTTAGCQTEESRSSRTFEESW